MISLSKCDILKLHEAQKHQNVNTHLLHLYNPQNIGNKKNRDLEEFPLVYDSKLYKFITYVKEYKSKLGSNVAIIEKFDKHFLSCSPQYVLGHYLMGDTGVNRYYQEFQTKLGDISHISGSFALGNMLTPNLDYTMWIRSEDLQLHRIFVGQVFLTVSQMRQLISQSPYRKHQILGFSDVTTPSNFEKLVNEENAAQFFDFIPFLRNHSKTVLEKDMVYITEKIVYCKT